MKSKFFVLALIVIILICSSAYGQTKSRLSFERLDGYSFGYTKYIMDLTGQSEFGTATLKSDLKFPLDHFMTGAKLNWEYNQYFDFEASFLMNINDPHGHFIDKDWYTGNTDTTDEGYFTGYFDGMFSYTESMVEARNYIGSIKMYYKMSHHANSSWLFYLGYRYQNIKHEAFGYSGWQIDIEDSDFPIYYFTDPTNNQAILYKVTYKSPVFGIIFRYDVGNRWRFDFDAAYLYITADDYDNHLLRGKDAVANSTGTGLEGKFKLKYNFSPDQNNRLYFGFATDLFYSSTKTQQVQTWYEAEGDIPAGTSIGQIPHQIKTLQCRINLSFGYYLN